ncbi:uncharacterized protein PGTG_20640 [Puccinia graminis f. sp. tritici CRL 75-36-700-3]|uniref:Uncharacterized protein n=1 Tax=Puccinia graminis f. sp. tritici (strain CRL 75-36-700-3 / race SCCL) TaxID=418459 RepID=H6QNT2_PUCGT|nr:uncharacterized protein PGTG_20640 [Puccinia graminis f. sp. tritici CRL 75-36-700-3]EHS62519.1 hypothetical protein PGTG_20640 [Puccinia graminis f. sp. tritici CRL 75-36-700-3]
MDPNNTAGEKEHWPQGDLVVRRFLSLISKCHPIDNGDPYLGSRTIQEGFLIEQVNMEKDLLTELRSDLLPQLGRQITDLVPPLDPARLKEDPGLQLRIVSGIQAELEQTLQQIRSALSILCPDPLPSERIRTNDQHLDGLKSFRREGLHYRIIEEILPDVMCLFHQSETLILQMKLSTNKALQYPCIAVTREQIIEYASSALEGIQGGIQWLEGSEFDLVQYDWPNEICGMDEQLEELLELINGTTHLKESSRIPGPLSDSVVQLSKSLLPILKLSRLFFNKLSKQGMNRKRLSLYTEIRSDQLDRLCKLAGNVNRELDAVAAVLRTADRSDGRFARPACTQIVGALEAHFESALLLLYLYFLPLIPDTDGFPIQNYFKAWFATWHTQFGLVIQNLIATARLFDEDAL